MNRLMLLVAVAVALPFVNRFQEVTVRNGGRILLQTNAYGQSVGIGLAAVLALVCLFALSRSVRARHGSLWRALKFWPALFAFPALWNNWAGSRFADGQQIIEIKSGLGGPLAGSLFLATAVALVAADAYLRERTRFPGQPPDEGPVDY